MFHVKIDDEIVTMKVWGHYLTSKKSGCQLEKPKNDCNCSDRGHGVQKRNNANC